ncbi:CAP domain-containing protein [Actinoplanes sp. NPDC051346]|uniref:CAP domain-containing protein n=1 Tax=Actinoplanes sp. NPDC051346 TaxID=3155048 RepID=UPI0034216C58
MRGPIEQTDTEQQGQAGRHRRQLPAALRVALPVGGVLAAIGVGAALLPSDFTGSGSVAERPVAAVAPAAGAGTPGAGSGTAGSPNAPGTSAAPAPSSKPPTTKPAAKKTTAPPAPKKAPVKTRKATVRNAEVAPGLAGQESEVIRLVNAERDRAGCGPVDLDTKLRTAMRLHVQELGTHDDLYISHVSDDGRDFGQRAREQGYDDPGGENVARGQSDAADVMTAWMNSPGHRANILNCDFKAIGAGAVKGVDGTIVWGQLFGRS